MIVLPRHRLVFLHIHKNAGSSVRAVLRHLGEEVANRTWNGQDFRGHVNWRDLTAAAPELAGFTAFATGRNPWSRLASAYHWWQSKPETRPGITRANLAALSSFGAFVAALARTAEAAAADPELAQRIAGLEAHSRVGLDPDLVHYPSQHSMVIDDAGRVRATLLPMERLSEVLPAFLTERLGRPVAWREIARNRNSTGDWRCHYTDRDAETVGRLYARDAALLGYRFEP